MDFYEAGQKVSGFHLSLARGKHSIYVDKSSYSEIEIHKIGIMNYLDSEEKYRVCLRPYLRKNLEKFEDNDTMLRIRIRDSYISGVTNVLWKVFDQIEVLAFPIYVKLTKTFYNLIQRIFFPENLERIHQKIR